MINTKEKTPITGTQRAIFLKWQFQFAFKLLTFVFTNQQTVISFSYLNQSIVNCIYDTLINIRDNKVTLCMLVFQSTFSVLASMTIYKSLF